MFKIKNSGVTRALIGGGEGRGGGVYSYILVLPDEFLLKSVVFKFISKEISRAEHEYINIHPPPPPPIHALVTPLIKNVPLRCSGHMTNMTPLLAK